MGDFQGMAFWHWWIAALALAGAEALMPGAVLIWLGAAAAVVGALLLAMPELEWRFQLLAFSAVSIVAVTGWRLFARRRGGKSAHFGLNRRAEQYLGRQVILETAIAQGRGRAYVGDTLWSVSGPDLPAGATVRVVGSDGIVLLVTPSETGASTNG